MREEPGGGSTGVERPGFPPPLGLAIAVISVSFAAPLFRLADAPALTASFWRLAFAVLILLPFTGKAAVTWTRYTASEWRITIWAGIALGAHFALWVSSLFYTTVAASVSLVTLQAVLVALGGHFLLGDRLSPRAWGGVVLAFTGVLVIAADELVTLGTGGVALVPGGLGDTSKRALFGNLLAFLGGFGSATYMLIGRRLRAKRELVEYVAPVYAVAALTILVALPLVGQPLTTGLPPKAFLLFVLLAAVPMLGGHTFANWCLKHMEAHVVATWILLEPLGAALLAWPMLDEVPSILTALGGALVLLGAMQTIRRAPARTQESITATD